MSGPKTANYSLDRAILNLERNIIRRIEEQERQARAAARKAEQGRLAQAAERKAEEERLVQAARKAEQERLAAERKAEQERQARIIKQQEAAREAERKRLAKLQEANKRAQIAQAELQNIRQNLKDFIANNPNDVSDNQVPAIPAYPSVNDLLALEHYVNQAEKISQNIQSRLQQLHANTNFKNAFAGLVDFDFAPPKTAADLIKSLAQSAAVSVQENQLLSRKAEAEKLTQRIENLGLAEIGVELRGMLQEFLTTDSASRVDILGTEIRLKTQALLNDVKQIELERQESETLIEKLLMGDDSFENSKLREQLALAAAGVIRLSSELKRQAQKTITELEQSQLLEAQQQDQDAAADILSHVFKDLGYEIEPISHTLFGEGGTIHFRQSGWDKDYFVRMKVQPDRQIANFNMVRIDNGSSETEVQKIQDTKMENVWCSDPSTGFKQLQQVAADRGLVFDSFRQIQPGQLAVQVVPKESVALADQTKQVKQTQSQTAQPLREQHLR